MFDIVIPPTIFGVKAERGITIAQTAAILDYAIAIGHFEPLTDVQPGRDNKVTIENISLPPNANVETVKAWLHVGDADRNNASPATTTGVAITKTAGASPDQASGSFRVAVDQPARPRSVKLQLDGGGEIWTSGGVLTEEKYQLPDFSQALNAYLDTLKATAPLTKLTFLFKTDAPGKVGIEIETLTFSQVKTQSWRNPLDGTKRVDRTLTLAFGDVQHLPLEPILDGTPAGGGHLELQSVKLDLGGQLGPDRLLGTVETHDGRQFATISNDYSLAQAVTLSSNAEQSSHTRRCSGIICFFTSAAAAELYVELQKDENGFPASGAPLAKANLTFKPPEQKDAPQPWTFARFGTPVDLNTGTQYWAVVKGVRGTVSLGLMAALDDHVAHPAVRGPVYINRGGQVWKPMFRVVPNPPITALVGVVYLPGNDDQTAAIQITLTDVASAGVLPPMPADPGRAPQTVALPDVHGKPWNESSLEIRSHAQGTLNVANVIQAYKVVAG